MDVESGGSRWGLYLELRMDQTALLVAPNSIRTCSRRIVDRWSETGRCCWKWLVRKPESHLSELPPAEVA